MPQWMSRCPFHIWIALTMVPGGVPVRAAAQSSTAQPSSTPPAQTSSSGLQQGSQQGPPPATEPDTRQGLIEQEKADKALRLTPPVRRRGDTIVTRAQSLLDPRAPGIELSFGGFRPGAGIAPGLGYTDRAGTLGRWTVRGAWSTRNFKLGEGRFDVVELAGGRLAISATTRWEDAPQLHFFGLGGDSVPADEAHYGLRSTEAGGQASLRAMRHVRVGGGAAYLDVEQNAGHGPFGTIGDTFDPVTAPGIGTHPAWVHSHAFVAYDWREADGYTRRGGLYRAAYHDYHTLAGEPASFGRLDLDARQFFPILHENWIVAIQARTQFITTSADQTVPFFMLPYLGGGDSLRGYRQYRFVDRQSLLLRSELRWTPSSILDMAVFLDQGKVGPRRRDLDLQDLDRGWGVGGRFHTASGTGLRMEVARGAEGWRFHVAQSASF